MENPMKEKVQITTILKIIAVIMLLLALADNPYWYYRILRYVITGITAYLAYLAYQQGERTWTWIFTIIAILFNPIAPIYLNRGIWSVIDIITATLIFTSIFKLKLVKKP